jgi:hypothetical protein
MYNHSNLIFFNKEGDSLNFQYNEQNAKFEGDILFHESSTDIYKTYGIYTLERIPESQFEDPDLRLNKFQLFNDWGIHFYGDNFQYERVTKIEPTNNDSDFYSKWVYGVDFDKKFPVGTLIAFTTNFLEFDRREKTYVVLGTKEDAIMILSSIDNASFENDYYNIYTDNVNYVNGVFIKGVNAIGIYNYIDSEYQNRLSDWSEPEFYRKLYNGKKLNVINSKNNDGIYTISNSKLVDSINFEYSVTSLPDNSDLIIEVINKNDLPMIYNGNIKIVDNNVFFNGSVPEILKPNTEFKIIGSKLNSNFLTVVDLPDFLNFKTTYYATQSQVLFNNEIYECIQAYTHSFAGILQFMTPDVTTQYWSKPTHIKVKENIIPEVIGSSQIYLTTNRNTFYHGWTQSQKVTLASAALKYKEELRLLGVDLYYDKNLKADLIYSSKYAEVNFYHTKIDSNNLITSVFKTNERLIEVEENLNNELNYDISENYKFNIVFQTIDNFGLKIRINKQYYEGEIIWIYSNGVVDMERTIDRTLRSWITKNYVILYTLGIVSELSYIGDYNSPYYNTLILRTYYPNVPIDINDVKVGTNVQYYIRHSSILIQDSRLIGPNFTIRINNKEYSTITDYLPNTTPKICNVATTLQKWVSDNYNHLYNLNIKVSSIGNLLNFDLLSIDKNLEYNLILDTGKTQIPGNEGYKITKFYKGNLGCLISSNEINLTESSKKTFENGDFATGMVVGINATNFTYNNQEYNIQFLDPKIIGLSYKGPFWAIEDSICNSSAFTTLAFDIGFGATACVDTNLPNGPSFNDKQFSKVLFSVENSENEYKYSEFDLSGFYSNNNIDIKYIQLSNTIYVFGSDLIILDATTMKHKETIRLNSLNSLKMEYNPTNGYLYCLSNQAMYIIDVTTNVLVSKIIFSKNTSDICFDSNGLIYISFSDWNYIKVYTTTQALIDILVDTNPTIGNKLMIFNRIENSIYISTTQKIDSNQIIYTDVYSINTTTRIKNSTIVRIDGNLKQFIYEPITDSIYVSSDISSIFKIKSNIKTEIVLPYSNYKNLIFNNLTNEINISSSDGKFYSIDLNNNIVLIKDTINYGNLTLNQFDSYAYMTSEILNIITVIDPVSGKISKKQSISGISTKILYNPIRKSIISLIPSTNKLSEITTYINSTIEYSVNSWQNIDSKYGSLDKFYIDKKSLWLNTREYLRRPRENFNNEVKVSYYWLWEDDDKPEFFFYDVSGEQLTATGSYEYTGPTPLGDVPLSINNNSSLDKVSYPEYQKTIFNYIEYDLDYIDSQSSLKTNPKPLELFIGFKANEEGTYKNILKLYKSEPVSLEIKGNINDIITLKTQLIDGEIFPIIEINYTSSINFLNKGLKEGQVISLTIKDITNKTNQYISKNNSAQFIIDEIYFKLLKLRFIDTIEEESTTVINYPSLNLTTYLSITIDVLDIEIGSFNVYGQTEIEDIRFKTELNNIGKNIDPYDIFIFKEYDIYEGGIDWSFLNKKRKELLLMKSQIFPYIGSYKSIINSINFFGYNDLTLNEYYRNLDPNSENFNKLVKVEIPDIFDNSVEGWTENDFIKNHLPSNLFEETNMFNLTYPVTDKEGNNILNYDIDEVTIKLQGLKYWLRRNIIPLSHKILDITGQSYTNNETTVTHTMVDTQIINMSESMTPISFKLNESYLMPVNSGSTVYTCVLDFYSIIEGLGSDKENTIKAHNEYINDIETPDYFNIKIRTYKTYKEWMPFSTYSNGDKVIYYGQIYESVGINKITNPKQFDEYPDWSPISYTVGDIVRYDGEYYSFTGLNQNNGLDIIPYNNTNWKNITNWKKVNYEPVQTINEWRSGDNLTPFNFTLDANIDPFVIIEVTSDNGYGAIYRDKKNYEIRTLKDLYNGVKYIESIGPFEPIKVLE